MLKVFSHMFGQRELLLTQTASTQSERIREMMTFLREEYPGGWEDTGRSKQSRT